MEDTPSKEQLLAEVESLRAEVNRLKAADKQLDEFIYLVSHDFNAPLRGIHSLTEWLNKDHAGQLSEDGKKLVYLIDERILKLVHMIDALLEYSRIGRIVEDPEDVDLSERVQKIFEALNPPGQTRLEVVGALPVIRCEGGRMEELFRILLDNAVYFMGEAGGLVRVACEEEGSLWRFSVADDGPGIKSNHYDRIFSMFQTLEVHKDPKRVGAGLALARKFVEHYGGEIWVDSELGKGTTFYFNWPKNIDA